MYLILGGQEWLIILIAIVIILIWGPSKLPSLARGMGEAIREFRKAASGVAEEEVRRVEKKEEILDEINRKLAELKKS
jgi:sec-independent protein translocase protein TatA